MNVNPGAGTNANANGVNNTSEFADIVVTGVTTLSFFLGYGVSTYAGDNYLNRACLAGVVGATGYLLAESVHHGVAALWNSAVAVHDSVTTLMTNLPITPFNEESHIVKASTYAGAYLGLRYSPLRQRPARNLVDPSAPPDPYIDNTFYAARVLMAGTSSAMLGGGVGYLLGKGLDLTAKAAISGAKMAADRLGLKTTVSESPEVASGSSGRIHQHSESAEEILLSRSAEMVRQRSPDGTETETHFQEAGRE